MTTLARSGYAWASTSACRSASLTRSCAARAFAQGASHAGSGAADDWPVGRRFRLAVTVPVTSASEVSSEALRLNAKSLRKTADNVETCVEGALFELAKITAADVRLMNKVILRDTLCITQSAQIDANTSRKSMREAKPTDQYITPRYTEQNDVPRC